MNEFQVKNINNIEPKTTERDGNVYHVKSMFDTDLLKKCTADFVEVEPGSTAYGYHYHESIEEIFYIISGEGSVRTINGEIPVRAGDTLSFPTGKGGAHVIRNTSSTDKLVYIDFGTRSECEIVHLPDSNQIMAVSRNTFGIFDAPNT